mmetsp:Transcript_31975/g.74907  ORF Transcript_31975/g.74907 Transcript_31975/m.74907 type:complete len:506 (+) Transcript_31975:222-1739(+)
METISEETSPQVSPSHKEAADGLGDTIRQQSADPQEGPEVHESVEQDAECQANAGEGLLLPVPLRESSASSTAEVAHTVDSEPSTSSTAAPLQTLTSGRRREVKGGVFQAHICVVASETDVATVMDAFRRADGFVSVACWSYAYRINVPSYDLNAEDGGGLVLREGAEDGLDEGSGERILGVLRRFALHGLLLIVSRWQDYGLTSGIELLGTSLYSIIVERCKDLILHLREAVGLSSGKPLAAQVPQFRFASPQASPRGPKVFDFGYLPPLPGPRQAPKYGPNHFMADMPEANKMTSLPHLFGGGADVRQWMENDRSLQRLPESEIRALRAMRLPDHRVERILHAVALLRGQRLPAASASGASRWGACREVLRSQTLRTELLLFDANDVPVEVAREAMQMLCDLSVDEVLRVSAGAAALLEWALGIARWRLDGPPRSTTSSGFSFRSTPKHLTEPQPMQKAVSCPHRGFSAGRRSRSATALRMRNMQHSYTAGNLGRPAMVSAAR